MSGNTADLMGELESHASRLGAKAFGVADLEKAVSTNPNMLERVGGAYTRGVVLGMRLQKGVLAGIADRPTPLYMHNYRQLNYQLDRAAWVIADVLQDAGFTALAVPASQIIERDPMLGHVSHRELGWAAGLGFWGRNNLLVHPEFGSQLRYVSILTDAPLEPDAPLPDRDCGDCFNCVDRCPARAIKPDRHDFDLNACYRKLCEFTRLPFVGQHICGVCVKHCPGKG